MYLSNLVWIPCPACLLFHFPTLYFGHVFEMKEENEENKNIRHKKKKKKRKEKEESNVWNRAPSVSARDG